MHDISLCNGTLWLTNFFQYSLKILLEKPIIVYSWFQNYNVDIKLQMKLWTMFHSFNCWGEKGVWFLPSPTLIIYAFSDIFMRNNVEDHAMVATEVFQNFPKLALVLSRKNVQSFIINSCAIVAKKCWHPPSCYTFNLFFY